MAFLMHFCIQHQARRPDGVITSDRQGGHRGDSMQAKLYLQTLDHGAQLPAPSGQQRRRHELTDSWLMRPSGLHKLAASCLRSQASGHHPTSPPHAATSKKTVHSSPLL